MGLVGAEPVGRSVEADDGGAVKEPVEHRGGNGRVAEGACPVGNTDVGCEDRARLQIPLVDHLDIVVFKYTARATHGTAGRGDLGTAIASAVGVAGVLGLLLAPSFGQAVTDVPGAPPARSAEQVTVR